MYVDPVEVFIGSGWPSEIKAPFRTKLEWVIPDKNMLFLYLSEAMHFPVFEWQKLSNLIDYSSRFWIRHKTENLLKWKFSILS